MSVFVASIALAMGIWGLIALQQASIPLSVALFLVATACLPAEFISVDVGGLTWTADRVWYAALLGQFILLWYRGKLSTPRVEATDILLAIFLVWLVLRTITQSLGSAVPGQPHTLMHLINGYLVPISLYWMLRVQRLDCKQFPSAVAVLVAFGMYLSATAICEKIGLWSLVFPSYIADPTLGIHFGRARGPMLQSVRLGVCLLTCLTCVMIAVLWVKPGSKPRWILAGIFVPLCCAAIMATLTRSIWMGLGIVVIATAVFCLRGVVRRGALFGLAMSAVVLAAIVGPNIVAFKREYSEAETLESTYMRGAFAYVSWKMICDRPVAGFGFNQFQVYNPPYLVDRTTNIRLESIRGYVHHNSYLSLLVDLGIIGFAVYMIAILAMLVRAWRLWSAAHVPRWARAMGLSCLVIAGIHAIQMAFHEVSFSSIENTILFGSLGLMAAAHRQTCGADRHQGPAGPALPIS